MTSLSEYCRILEKHPDLQAIVEVWPDLSEDVKKAIKKLIEEARQ